MSIADELRAAFLTSALTDGQRAEMEAAGREVAFAPGDVLFVEGEPAVFLWILLQGELELRRMAGGESIVMATMATPGQWAGGLQAWGEGAGYRGTGVAVTAGRALAVPSDDLKRMVAEWFPFGGHIIVGIFQTVRNIEAMVRQRESLVALGTMAAGLAHEINNPAAATLRAVNEMDTACDAMLGSLTDLAVAGIGADQFVALDGLRREAVAAEPPTGAMVLSDREDDLGDWLSAHAVDDAWQIAPTLAGAGVDVDWCERVLQAVGPAGVGGAFGWVASVVSATDLLGEMRDTTTRIAELVSAVKSYSQMDRSALQPTDVREGIDSTLVMLGHKLGGIEIDRRYAADLPVCEVYAGELNQVWTNLIDNAVDAMDGSGVLRITARVDGADLLVDLADTGGGMDADVLQRVFEPFFTTKGVGKGTGLGLDITRRVVVDRHGGSIDFESSPSGTIAHVRIPVQRPAPAAARPAR